VSGPRRREGQRWDRETFVCAFKGHATPAADVQRLRPEDAGLGVDLPDGRRLARCLRCDAWIQVMRPARPLAETLPALEALEVPRRGKALRDALILRLIAVDRAVHSILFGVLGAVLVYLELHLGPLRTKAQDLLSRLTGAASETGPGSSQSFIVRELQRFLHLRQHAILILAITAVAYCVVEGAEAVGLWLERRWAEYLTAIGTAGFLPFEIDELIKRVTVVRVLALVINVAILVYLVWKKRLFGVMGGPVEAEEEVDREAQFGPPQSPKALSASTGPA
jgi:uncharacterized membrane protein (DUF2068 family)